MKRTFLAAALLLTACSGQMQGMAHGPSGSSPASFTWNSNLLGGGTVTAMLDGESFQGNHSQATGQSSGTAFAVTNQGTVPIYGSSYQSSNSFQAVLFGNRGNSMNCMFTGDEFSGVGQCQVSDGRLVNVRW